MKVKALTPILNVSNMSDTFEWFASLGWEKGFEWGEPTGFASVCHGDCEIFLCLGGQGGRGKGQNETTFGDVAAETADKGVWLSMWLDTPADVDAVFALSKQAKLDITHAPEDMPWGVREMHLRHPDGHVFRIGCGLERP